MTRPTKKESKKDSINKFRDNGLDKIIGLDWEKIFVIL